MKDLSTSVHAINTPYFDEAPLMKKTFPVRQSRQQQRAPLCPMRSAPLLAHSLFCHKDECKENTKKNCQPFVETQQPDVESRGAEF
jgi:hypothetical protein